MKQLALTLAAVVAASGCGIFEGPSPDNLSLVPAGREVYLADEFRGDANLVRLQDNRWAINMNSRVYPTAGEGHSLKVRIANGIEVVDLGQAPVRWSDVNCLGPDEHLVAMTKLALDATAPPRVWQNRKPKDETAKKCL